MGEQRCFEGGSGGVRCAKWVKPRGEGLKVAIKTLTPISQHLFLVSSSENIFV